MATVSGRQFALTAIKRRHLGITYQQEMCDAFVENTLKAAGGPYKDFAGTNTMLRTAVYDVVPLAEAQRRGTLEPGMVLFIIVHDGGEPAKFRGDGLGNASHIGIYTGMNDPVNGEYVEVMHSSASRGGVYPSTLKNAWTHVAKYPSVAYQNDGQTPGYEQEVAPAMTMMTVYVEGGGTVNLRKSPSTSEKIIYEYVRTGTLVQARQHNGDWNYVITPSGNKGYMMSKFLAPAGTVSDAAPDHGGDGDMILVERAILRAICQEIERMLGE